MSEETGEGERGSCLRAGRSPTHIYTESSMISGDAEEPEGTALGATSTFGDNFSGAFT